MQIRAGHPCKAAFTTSPVAPQRASTLEQFGILGKFSWADSRLLLRRRRIYTFSRPTSFVQMC